MLRAIHSDQRLDDSGGAGIQSRNNTARGGIMNRSELNARIAAAREFARFLRFALPSSAL